MAGRPSYKVELSLTNPNRSLQQIKLYCEQSETDRGKVQEFAKELLGLTVKSTISETQTETSVSNILEFTNNFRSYEKSFLLSNIWNTLHPDFQVKIFVVLYSDLDGAKQSEIFALLGNSHFLKNQKQLKVLMI